MAGRFASTERVIMAAIRVMTPCFALGQAAVPAAAMSAVDVVQTKEVDLQKLVCTLQKDCVYLPEHK